MRRLTIQREDGAAFLERRPNEAPTRYNGNV